MLSFSPLLILAPYGLYMLVHFSLGLVNVKHIFKTGSASFFSYIITLVFLIYSLVVLSVTWNLIGSYSWDQPITFGIGEMFNTPGAAVAE